MIVLTWVWGLLWLAAASVCMAPWVERLWGNPSLPAWRLVRAPLVLGLSLGVVTLGLTVIGFWRLGAVGALACPLLVAVSTRVGRGHPPARPPAPALVLIPRFNSTLTDALRAGDLRLAVGAAGLGVLLAVVAHATYYPFIGDDELARYAYYARVAVLEGRVTDAVRGYPLLMTMAYAYVFLVTGQPAEQLARVVPVLLAVAVLMATGALGARWYGARAGWAAVFVLIASPLYLRWSPNGYLDIPSALFFLLTAYALDIWRETRESRWAVLTGMCAGLAVWTKQAGFLAVACAALVWAGLVVGDWRRGERARATAAWRDGLVALAAALLFGGWWYLRNAFYDGWGGAIPTPGIFYYPQARREWALLIPFVGYATTLGRVTSMLCLVGLLWAATHPRRAIWPLAWALSYTVVWWPWFSYDARFLLTVLPFYAILFGGAVSETRTRLPRPARWIASGAIVAIAVAAVWDAGLGGVRRWVVAPRATYAERLNRQKGGMYPTVEFLRDRVPATARVVTMDARMQYYLPERRLHVAYPTRLSELRRFDYLVAAVWGHAVYAGLGVAGNEVERALDRHEGLEPVYVSPEADFVVYQIQP